MRQRTQKLRSFTCMLDLHSIRHRAAVPYAARRARALNRRRAVAALILPLRAQPARLAAAGAREEGERLVNADVPHSFTYIPDAARALPLLAGAHDSWREVWHLPAAAPPWTGSELVAAARQLNVAPRLTVLRSWTLRLAGIVNGDIREAVEMLYQSALPYRFDSSKFERRFGVQPTPYSTRIAETAQVYKHGG